jgi:DNA mismatch repair ATPase MutL
MSSSNHHRRSPSEKGKSQHNKSKKKHRDVTPAASSEDENSSSSSDEHSSNSAASSSNAATSSEDEEEDKKGKKKKNNKHHKNDKSDKKKKNKEKPDQRDAKNNAFYDAKRKASHKWGQYNEPGSYKILMIGSPSCGARGVIKYLVTETAKSPIYQNWDPTSKGSKRISSNTGKVYSSKDSDLRGMIICSDERIDKQLRKTYPHMKWFSFFTDAAQAYWKKLNKSHKPYFVLASKGILSQHVDDDLLELVDSTRGILIIHQITTGLLDSIFRFDRILANADRKHLYPLCTGLKIQGEDGKSEAILDQVTWDNLCTSLIQDPKFFLDIQGDKLQQFKL